MCLRSRGEEEEAEAEAAEAEAAEAAEEGGGDHLTNSTSEAVRGGCEGLAA